MAETRDWRAFRDANAARLERQTGADVATWNARIAVAGLSGMDALRVWLKAEGVTGYSAQLLRYETFGYPDFMTATADDLIEGQFADRAALRPIYDALVEAALDLGEVAVQARKTYVSLLTPRRTFARVQPTTKARLDVGLRLDGQSPGGRLLACRIHETMPVQLSLTRAEDLDAEALDWLERAYRANL
jgi:hypothetical protein